MFIRDIMLCKLEVNRFAPKSQYTIGDLYVDGSWFCNTLEPPVRDLKSDGSGKIWGDTAIPAGTYCVKMYKSPKFSPRYGGRLVPLLLNVPFFSGILIHSGNTVEDTDGCILVGLNRVKGQVLDSKATLYSLLDVLDKLPYDASIQITIK